MDHVTTWQRGASQEIPGARVFVSQPYPYINFDWTEQFNEEYPELRVEGGGEGPYGYGTVMIEIWKDLS